MQVRLYNIVKNLHEVCLGSLSIYYSFKMPVAYRRKREKIVIRDTVDPQHFKEIVVNQPYEKVEMGKFLYGVNRMIEAEIADLYHDTIKIRGKKQHEKDKRDCRQSESGTIVNLSNRYAKKRQ